jgi:hypothetical protein
MRIKLNTVNVIEVTNGSDLQSLRAFADVPKGNKRAEKLFRRLIEEYEKPFPEAAPRSDEEDFESYIEEGLYERTGYELLLTHSV